MQALTLDTLLERTGRPDFVKMDIEGAERAVLNQSVGWAEHVRELVVECHDGYQNDQCATDLAALGFAVEVTPQRLSVDTVRGIRKVSVRTS